MDGRLLLIIVGHHNVYVYKYSSASPKYKNECIHVFLGYTGLFTAYMS